MLKLELTTAHETGILLATNCFACGHSLQVNEPMNAHVDGCPRCQEQSLHSTDGDRTLICVNCGFRPQPELVRI